MILIDKQMSILGSSCFLLKFVTTAAFPII